MKLNTLKNFGLVSVLVLILAACSGEKETDLNSKDDAATVEAKVTQVQEETEKETYNEELTLKVLENANVVKGYVHEEDKQITATLVLKETVSLDNETKLMKQFADEITELYPVKNVNIVVTKKE